MPSAENLQALVIQPANTIDCPNTKRFESWVLSKSVRAERLLEKSMVIVSASLALSTLIIFVIISSRSHPPMDDAIQWIEIVIVFVMGIVSTENFLDAGKRMQEIVCKSSHPSGLCGPNGVQVKTTLLNNVFGLINICWFIGALYQLLFRPEKPFLYVATIFMIFLTFTTSNLWQARRLQILICRACMDLTEGNPPPATSECPNQDCLNKQGQKRSGIFLLTLDDWLRTENVPSMVAYSILLLMMGYATFRPWLSVELIRPLAAGAATFHLALSICAFKFGLKHDPWQPVVDSASWGGETRALLREVMRNGIKASELWLWWLRLSVVFFFISVILNFVPLHSWKSIVVAHSNTSAQTKTLSEQVKR